MSGPVKPSELAARSGGVFEPPGKASKGLKDERRLMEACKEFESIFIFQLLKIMRQTVHKSGFIDGGRGEEIFQSMLDEEYAKAITRTSGLGLAEKMFEQLVNRDVQEKQKK